MRLLAAQFWAIAKPYWVSEERWAGRALLAVIVAINLTVVWVNVRLNTWNGEFYNSLQDKKFDLFKSLLWEFGGWALLYIVLAVYQLYLTQMLQIRWRRWLTERWLQRWTAHQAYYRLNMFDKSTDNPDQRIAEDLREFVNDTLSLSIGLLSSVVSFISFVGILWTLSGAFEIMGVSIPGYMVWVAIVYALFGSLLAHWIGKPLVNLNVNQQRFEADFRYGLIRFRDNAEAVALYRAETQERTGLDRRFAQVVANWWEIMKRQKRFTWFASFYGQAAIIFPIIVASPGFFAGKIQLGGLMQIASAFSEVQKALSWFVDAYVRVAGWRSAIERLHGFSLAMDGVSTSRANVNIEREKGADHLAVNADIQAPDGRLLFGAKDIQIKRGQHTVVNGASGSGKSTLFRVLAGIWPYVQGEIKTSHADESLYLPQKPYLPLGTLRACVSYPSEEGKFSDAEIQGLLAQLDLEKFNDDLNRTELWHSAMSPGEQQRLSIVRALLHQPDWLYLDEATSALNEATEAKIYALLLEKIPKVTLISIAHRAAVDRFNHQKLVVRSNKLVSEIIKGER